jgi:serine/threonine-protein kinase RsbW
MVARFGCLTLGRHGYADPKRGRNRRGSSILRQTTAEPLVVEAPIRGVGRAVRLEHRPPAVPVARRTFAADVSTKLGDEATELLISEASVVVSELLGNAVRHAGALDDGTVLLRWQVRDGVVDIEVTDGGGESDVRPARLSSLATHGRGLRIVRSLAHEWGVVEDHGQRTVWACLGGPTRRRRTA